MYEWLRRWTRNPLGSDRGGSHPLGVEVHESARCIFDCVQTLEHKLHGGAFPMHKCPQAARNKRVGLRPSGQRQRMLIGLKPAAVMFPNVAVSPVDDGGHAKRDGLEKKPLPPP